MRESPSLFEQHCRRCPKVRRYPLIPDRGRLGPNEKGVPIAKNRGLFRRPGAAPGSCRTVVVKTLSKLCRSRNPWRSGTVLDSGKLLMSLTYRRVTTRSDLGPLRATVRLRGAPPYLSKRPLTARRAWAAICVTRSESAITIADSAIAANLPQTTTISQHISMSL
jgi:hypothetical protein